MRAAEQFDVNTSLRMNFGLEKTMDNSRCLVRLRARRQGVLLALGVFMTATMLAGCSPTAGPRIVKHVPAVAKAQGEVQGEVKVGLPTIETPPAEKTPV